MVILKLFRSCCGLFYKLDPGEKLRHGVALRTSVTLVKSCELLSLLDYFTLVL